jgi:hypothetical protein
MKTNKEIATKEKETQEEDKEPKFACEFAGCNAKYQ